MNSEQIKNFYSHLHFPGRYTQQDLEFYEAEGVDVNVYLREINKALGDNSPLTDLASSSVLDL